MSALFQKERAPRNRTLTIDDKDLANLPSNTFTLDASASASDITNVIINQDLFDSIQYLPDDFVDLLIVDPPYNLTKTYSETKFYRTDEEKYEAWLDSWLEKIVRCLRASASIYVCCDWQSSSSVLNVLKKYFVVRNRITWEREKGRGAKSNWKNCSEDIWFCTMGNDYFFNVDAVKLKKRVIAPYRNEEGDPKDWQKENGGNFRLTHPSNLWTDISIPFWSMPENTDHPTQKPEKLVAKLILASSKTGDFVFDPFLGSGTTCVAAKKLERKYCGIEIEPVYAAYAAKRLLMAETDNSIQGYQDGYFWERNSLSEQKTSSKLNPELSRAIGSLFDV